MPTLNEQRNLFCFYIYDAQTHVYVQNKSSSLFGEGKLL